jgi:hypothetical protein
VNINISTKLHKDGEEWGYEMNTVQRDAAVWRYPYYTEVMRVNFEVSGCAD